MACDIMEVEPHTGIIGKVSVTCKHQSVTEIFELVSVEKSQGTIIPAGASRRLHLAPGAVARLAAEGERGPCIFLF